MTVTRNFCATTFGMSFVAWRSNSANIGRELAADGCGISHGALSKSFSVVDILSPVEKYGLDTIGTHGTGGVAPAYSYPAMQAPVMPGMTSMYPGCHTGYVPQLSPHHAAPTFPTQYCGVGPCTDYGPYATSDPVTVRTTTTCWYSPNHETRFASKCSNFLLINYS